MIWKLCADGNHFDLHIKMCSINKLASPFIRYETCVRREMCVSCNASVIKTWDDILIIDLMNSAIKSV